MVAAGTRLGDFPTMPVYNIKAVVNTTGITPSTLRAWERRYDMCRPERSETGYRLYSERDLAVIRWLKAQVDAGMTISQAVTWMNSVVDEAGGLEKTVLPSSVVSNVAEPYPGRRDRDQARDFESLQRDLLGALLTMQEPLADSAMTEAFGMYSVECVGEHLLMPVLVEIGERWHRGETSSTEEHFATNYVIQQVSALLRTAPKGEGDAQIWVGCAPHELHEVGAMLVTLNLRRAGHVVRYFGQNIQEDDIGAAMARHVPEVLLLSASTEESAASLASLFGELAKSETHNPLLGYGGQIFEQRPELRSRIAGSYMGSTALRAVDAVGGALRQHLNANGRN